MYKETIFGIVLGMIVLPTFIASMSELFGVRILPTQKLKRFYTYTLNFLDSKIPWLAFYIRALSVFFYVLMHDLVSFWFGNDNPDNNDGGSAISVPPTNTPPDNSPSGGFYIDTLLYYCTMKLVELGHNRGGFKCHK